MSSASSSCSNDRQPFIFRPALQPLYPEIVGENPRSSDDALRMIRGLAGWPTEAEYARRLHLRQALPQKNFFQTFSRRTIADALRSLAIEESPKITSKAPATKPETPAVAPDPSAVAAKAPPTESALPAVRAKTPVNAQEISAGTPENLAVQPIVPAVTTDISAITPEAPTVELEIPTGKSVVLGTLTSPPAALEEASPKSSPQVTQIAEATSSRKHANALVLALAIQMIHHSPAALIIPADFVPLPNASFVPYVEALLQDSATAEYAEEEAASAVGALIDPKKSKLNYVNCFNKKAHALAQKLRLAQRQRVSSPCLRNTFVLTPKGLAQRDLPSFMKFGTAEFTPFSSPLRHWQINLQHAFFEFPWFVKDPEDRIRFAGIYCAAAGIDRQKAYIAIHDTEGEFYRHLSRKPHATHCHVAFVSSYRDAFRRINSHRHVGVLLAMNALDLVCGNPFRVPRYNLASYKSVLADSYLLNYRALPGDQRHRRSLAELLESGLRANGQDISGMPRSHDLFDDNWINQVLPPDDLIERYSFRNDSRALSDTIHRFFRLGGKTQRKKIQADLNAADRFQAASEKLTNRPLEQITLPQHLLRRGADIMLADNPNIDDCRRFMDDCLGAHADPETKAATLLLLAGGLRQGKAESLRCVRYWTGQ